jgi:NADPH2:quinone reductase
MAVREAVFGVLENVGGSLLAEAFSLVADGSPSTINFEAEHRGGARKRLEPFTVRTPFRADLEYLLELVTAEAVDPRSVSARPGRP